MQKVYSQEVTYEYLTMQVHHVIKRLSETGSYNVSYVRYYKRV